MQKSIKSKLKYILKNKKILVIAVLIVFALNIVVLYNTFSEKTSSTVWDGSIAESFSRGTGVVTDPYVISDGSELAYFFTLINGKDYLEYFNKYYVLDNNIDLDGKDFSFAKSGKQFSGNFNGQGYSIFNFKIAKRYYDTNEESSNYSLFDTLSGATIENINFRDIIIVVGNDIKVIDDIEENATIEENNTIEENKTEEDNKTIEENNTIEENKTVEENSTVEKNETVEENKTIEENSTIEKNEPTEKNETVEDNKKIEDNSIVEKNETNEETKKSVETKIFPKEDTVENKTEENETEKLGFVNTNIVRVNSDNNETNETVDGTKDKEEPNETVEVVKPKVNASLFKNASNSTIKNISINNIQVTNKLNDKFDIETSLFLLNDVEYNNISNINIDGKSDLKDTTQLINNYNDAKIKTILYTNDKLELVDGYSKKDEFYKYEIVDGNAIFDEKVPVNTVLALLNENSEIEWSFSNNMFRLINIGVDLVRKNISSIKLRATAPSAHSSGVEGNTVYVNNYTSDSNYYRGLNYTYSSNGVIPTKVNKNIYNENNLVYVQLNYFGTDVDGDYTGYVSTTERYNKFVYYVVTPVVKVLGEDVVKLELIDNPFADRPSGRAFNGWVTMDTNSLIKLDTDTYTRYIQIPVTYNGDTPNAISVDIYASWTREHYTTISGDLDYISSTNLDTYGTHIINEREVTYEDLTDYYYYGGSTSNYYYPSNVYKEDGTLTGNYTRCRNAPCRYYRKATNPFNSTYEYYQLVNGEMTPYTPTYTTSVDYVVNVGKSLAGYYRKVADNKVPRGANYGDYFYSTTSSNSSNTHPLFYSRGDEVCSTTGGCSINNVTIYEMIPYYDEYGNPNVVEENSTEEIYYLATRDTNIIRVTGNIEGRWDSSLTKPFTLTGLYNNTQHTRTWTFPEGGWFSNGANVVAYTDLRIEHLRIDSNKAIQNNSGNVNYNATGNFAANYKNVKLGRGITRGDEDNAAINGFGGSPGGNIDTGSTPIRYRLIVESGFYNATSATSLANGDGTAYVQMQITYGCDLDRVRNDNLKLDVRYCSSGSFGGTIRSGSSDKTVPALTTVVKSGTFGSDRYDFTTGIYLGGQVGGKHLNLRVGIIEGGNIFNLIGGPLSDSSEEYYNDTIMYIKGGTIDVVVGGAGRTETYANRIIQMSGGKVNYSIFGGSNGVTGEDGGQQTATLKGETYIYVGGGAEVGNETLVNNNTTETVSKVEAGSVFGAGNGNSDNSELGSVYKSTIIIDEDATIRRNVYGGGNFGSTGFIQGNNGASTSIKILNGTINGNVYGAGNNNGSGGYTTTRVEIDRVSGLTNNQAQTYRNQGYTCTRSGNRYTCVLYENHETDIPCDVDIEMSNGKVKGSIFGGSRTKGVTRGDVSVKVLGGTVSTDVYGGGEGGYTNANNPGTFVTGNVSVTIGDTSVSTSPTISGSVYGGSAYGTVNASSTNKTDSSKSVTVTLNKGNVVNDIYGGAKGSSTYTPYVSGNITVTTNGGTATNVFGGCNVAGKPAGTSIVTLNGGTFTNAYGGGNQTSLDYTNINLKGATVGTLYGGSNQSGEVKIATVNIDSGTVTTAFGGNNSGGSCGTTKVTVKGATISSALYGGGNQVDTNETDVRIQNISNTVPKVFGGGNSAGAGTTSVKLLSTNGANNINITELYGGSNATGDVTTSQVDINHGTIGTVYGANNAGGTVTTTTVNVTDGTITDIYGGGNAAPAGSTNVNISNGTITNVYGGGKGQAATVSGTTNVTFNGGTISDSLFGGGNAGVVQGNTNVTINRNQVATTVKKVYGGGNQADIAANSTVTINNGTVNASLFGGGNEGDVNGTTNVYINGGTVNETFGGGNKADVKNGTNVTMTGGTVTTNLFGGGNEGPVTGDTTIAFNGGTAHTIYGGGNQAAVTGDTDITVNGGIITTALYGGGNAGAVNGSTSIDIKHSPSNIPVVYGGGKSAGATTTSIVLSEVTNGSNNIRITELYGGSNQAGDINETSIEVNTGIVGNIYGGNNAGGKVGNTNIDFINGQASVIYGGGNAAQVDSTMITITDGVIDSVYGGCNAAVTNEDTFVTINGGSYTGTIYGGGNQGAVTGDTHVVLKSNQGTISNVFGGGNQAGAGNTYVNINTSASGGVTVTNLFGGSNSAGTVGTTNVTKNAGTVTNLYGGNNAGGTVGTTNVTINGGNITDNLFGGGNAANAGESNITLNNGTVQSIYGGGNYAAITGDTTVNITGGMVLENVFGGGCLGEVQGSTDVLVNNGSISGSVYAGGDGSSAIVYGDTKVSIGGNTNVGNDGCTLLSQCSVFGGGNAAKTGTENDNTSQAIVNITGGNIYGNIYGGANTSKVCGTTTVNVGADSPSNENLTKAPIHIRGTVFGGGEANASGSEFYDWTFISVTNGIDVNINGDDYDLTIDGSIFGSGNASTTSGVSTITIKNFGTYDTPKKCVSIQRTNLLTIDNSALVLSGAADRTNDYSDVKFTLSLINELDLMNNSTLYLETGTNILQKFKSLTGSGQVAKVEIDSDGKTVTKNVDNRIYILSGKNINIAKNANVTDYGEVVGMTFFGMYKYNGDRTVNQGIYDKYDFDEVLDMSGTFTQGSYVLGLHKVNHDIEVDGFYTNVMDEENGNKNIIEYIVPEPPASAEYMWVVGKKIISYQVDLIASKYSTLGTYELSLRDFTLPNTSFEIISFDTTELNETITLTDKNSIPRVATNETVADTLMGLTMETSNSGWLVNGYTEFRSDTNESIQGTKNYIGGNNTLTPSLLFCLHHAKNIATAGDMGTVEIQLLAVTQLNDLEKQVERLAIQVNLSRVLYTTADYEGAMTAGRKYELFTSTATNITSSASISAYYALFHTGESAYKTGYYRALVSNYVLPLGTKITMLDLSGDNVDYYYHVISASDVANAQHQLETQGDIQYLLSMFEVMGAQNSGVYYDDAQKNIEYFEEDNGTNPDHLGVSDEEFIFILDFDDCNIPSDQIGCSLLIEMLNADGETVNTVLGPQQNNLRYNIYANNDALIDINGSIDRETIYSGESVTMDLTVDYTQSQINGAVVYDTHLFDQKLGIKISLLNSEGHVVSGASLLGLYYSIGNEKYYPNIDGTTRIKIADRVDSVEKWVVLNTSTSNLATGSYKIRIESYGSPDGIYYGLNSSDVVELDVDIVNEIYGLDAHYNPEQAIIDGETGYNSAGSRSLQYTFDYNSGLTRPSIRVKMYRRDYTQEMTAEYHLVDAADYFDSALAYTNVEKEYKIIDRPTNGCNFTFTTKEGLLTGTYRLEFILYDNNSPIGSIEKYIIIK